MQHLVVDRHTELRLLQGTDAPLLAALIASHRTHLGQWLPWVGTEPSASDAMALIEATLERHANLESWEAGIFCSGFLVGMAGFNELDWSHRRGTLGYWLAADRQGAGIATRAGQALLDQGFTRWDLNRVEIRCSARNDRSRAVARRLGFSLEGCLRQAEWLHDRFEDHEVYGLLAADWQPGPTRGRAPGR